MENDKIKQIARKGFHTLKQVVKISIYTCLIIGIMYIGLILFWFIYNQPSKNNFDRRIWWEYFWEKDKNGECIIDLAETMSFEWDSLVHCHPTQEMNMQGICSSEYTNIRFMRNGNVVYYAEWFPYPPEYSPGEVIFRYKGDMLTVYPHDAKFKAYKDKSLDHEYYSKYIILEKVE